MAKGGEWAKFIGKEASWAQYSANGAERAQISANGVKWAHLIARRLIDSNFFFKQAECYKLWAKEAEWALFSIK